MKKQLHTSLLSLLACAGSIGLSAQAIVENFSPNPQSIFSNGWAQQNLSTPVGTVPNWFNGNATVFAAYSAPDSSYIGCNYNSVAGAATISNWLFAPTRTFNNGDVITFFTRTVDTPTYPDRLEVRLSTNGASVNAGATNTSVGDFTTLLLTVNSGLTTSGYPNVWTQYTVTISGLSSPTAGRVAFRYFVTNGGPSGANSDFIGIDNFTYTPAATPDVSVDAFSGEYTLIPMAQVAAVSLTDTVNNTGTLNVTDAVLTAKVYLAPNFVTPIQTTTAGPVAIMIGQSQTLTAGSFTPSAVGTYRIVMSSSCTNNSVNSTDTSIYEYTVTDSTYARDNGNIIGALGIGAGNGGYLGNDFEILTPTPLTSVTMAYIAGYTGEPYAAVIWDMVAGVPNAIIGSTDTLLYPNDSALVTTTNISGGSIILAPGRYAVTVVEFDSTVQIGHTSAIFTLGTTWVNWPTSPAGGWANNEFFGVPSFNRSYVIRPNFGCPVTTSVQSMNVCYGQTVTVGSNTYSTSGTYTDTLTSMFGCDSIVTTNLTIAPMIDTTTSVNGYVINANDSGATSYQWIDCNNGNAPIGGATNYIYAPSVDGNYAVIITVGSCSDTSDCVNILGLGMNSAAAGVISVYPNPNAGSFVISSMEEGQYVITNQLGQKVTEVSLNQQNNYRAALNNLAAGVYTISGYAGDKFVTQRIVVSEK